MFCGYALEGERSAEEDDSTGVRLLVVGVALV